MAQRKICPACGKPFQKGRRVLFAARTGLRSARVCQPCANGGEIIVQDKSGDVSLCTNCETGPAVFCSVCVMKKIHAVKGVR